MLAPRGEKSGSSQFMYSPKDLKSLLECLGLERHLVVLSSNEFEPESCALATDNDWVELGIPLEDAHFLRQATRHLAAADAKSVVGSFTQPDDKMPNSVQRSLVASPIGSPMQPMHLDLSF
jgi:hypothetical protein